jgi:predicted NAD-dependent protein-ADP-ribosyltransferase YbiA (DUF1768 family)
MCNFCKFWHHRQCIHPTFLDRDITAVKKEFVLLICTTCAERLSELVSSAVARANSRVETKSAAIQCNILEPSTNVPLIDREIQANIQPINPTEADDVEIIDEIPPLQSRKQKPLREPRSEYYVIRGIDDPCSNLYEFDFTFHHPQASGTSDFTSVEQAYKYFRVLPNDPAIADEIQRENCPYKIMQIAKKCTSARTQEDITLMEKLVKAKVNQCRAFRDTMRAATTMNLKFIHSTYPSDNVFGSGLKYDESHIPIDLPGQNLLGKIVAECAKSLKPEAEYRSEKINYEIINDVAYILRDGEKLPYSLRKSHMPPRNWKPRPIPEHEKRSPWRRHGNFDPDWAYVQYWRSRKSREQEDRNRALGKDKDRPMQRPRGTHICFHCSVPGHVMKDCRLLHVKVMCHACGREGHKKKYCVFNQGASGNAGTHQSDLHATAARRDDTCNATESNVPLNQCFQYAPAYVYRSELFPPLPPPPPPNF